MIPSRFPGLAAAGRIVLAVSALLLVAACGVPSDVIDRAPGQSAASRSAQPGGATDASRNSTAADRKHQFHTVDYVRTIVDIERGTVVGGHNGNIFCAGPGAAVTWNEGRITIDDLSDEFQSAFFDGTSRAGLPVAVSRNSAFQNETDSGSSQFAVAGVIKSIRMLVCDRLSVWDLRPLNIQRGEGNVTVEWQVFSRLERRVIYRTETTGYGVVQDAIPDGTILLIQRAFLNAAEQLAADEGYLNTLARASGERTEAHRRPEASPIRIARSGVFSGRLSENMNRIRRATVTIELNGHGSGFVISREGWILTNQHVVGSAEQVRVIPSDGEAIIGRVVRRDEQRDVALIKVDRRLAPLPIRGREAQVGEDVYAVGTPLTRELQTTVTRGVVSAIREASGDGLRFIQADVDVHAGNSGGPLVDRSGNVVGMTVSGITSGGGTSVGLNFFIPIDDALRALNIRHR